MKKWTKKQENLELDISKSLNRLIQVQENPKLFAHLGKSLFILFLTLLSLKICVLRHWNARKNAWCWYERCKNRLLRRWFLNSWQQPCCSWSCKKIKTWKKLCRFTWNKGTKNLFRIFKRQQASIIDSWSKF